MDNLIKILVKANASVLTSEDQSDLLEYCYKICFVYVKNNASHINKDTAEELIIKALQFLFTETENKNIYILTRLKGIQFDSLSFLKLFDNLKSLLAKSIERELKNYPDTFLIYQSKQTN